MINITFNIWSVLILVGAMQGLFLSLYLFLKNENRNANKWLAFLLIVVSLHLLEYAVNISGISLKYPFLVAITYPLLFCMGPLYFIFCQYLLDKNFRITPKWSLHFTPALFVLLIMLPFYLMPAAEKINYLNGLSENGVIKIPNSQLVFMAIHILQTIVYVFITYKNISKKEEEFKKFSSNVFLVKKISWLNNFSFYFSIYLLLYILLVITLTFIDSYQIQIDYVMLLITSISIYSIGYTAISTPEIFKAATKIELQKSESFPQNSVARTRNRNKHPELKEKLILFMENNKPYLKSDLRILELADSLSIPHYQLSQLINDEFAVNFYDFINQYRVEEAKKLLIEDIRNLKILAIAYEVGFNSKATFNRVFKKSTKLTPSQFKEKFSTVKF